MSYEGYYQSYRPPVQPAPSNKPPNKSKKKLKIFGLLLIVVLVFLVFPGSKKTLGYIDHTLIDKKLQESKSTSEIVKNVNLAKLSDQVNGVINNNSDIDFSVSTVDLSNNQTEDYGDNSSFLAASTAKVITATDFLKQVELGNESLSEDLDGNTAQYELQQMIVESDDNAWDTLNDELSYSQLQDYSTQIGASSYNAISNSMTSSDMALVLQKLYEGQLLNASDTQLLLSYMQQANYQQYILPAIPSDFNVYHKVGFYEDYVNDSAIINKGNQTIVLVIYTNGNGVMNWTQRAQLMQQIAKYVLSAYFINPN